MMAFKKKFYIPSFVSTTWNPKSVFYEPFPQTDKDYSKSYQNIFIEIDLTEYPNRSTLLRSNQSVMTDDDEVLLSCYNIYEYVGYRCIKWSHEVNGKTVETMVPVVSLRVCNFEKEHNPETHNINGTMPLDPDIQTWVSKRAGLDSCRREITSQDFDKKFNHYAESYQRWVKDGDVPAIDFKIDCKNSVGFRHEGNKLLQKKEYDVLLEFQKGQSN